MRLEHMTALLALKKSSMLVQMPAGHMVVSGRGACLGLFCSNPVWVIHFLLALRYHSTALAMSFPG